MNEFGTAVILAGGKSLRMGTDKQLLTINSVTIPQRACSALGELFDDIAVVTYAPKYYTDSPFRVLTDSYINMGPLAGIQAALKNARSKYVYILACDMPIVCPEYIQYMMQRLRETPASVCAAKRNGIWEPFNAFYSVDLLESAEERLRKNSVSIFRFIRAAAPLEITEREAAAFDPNLTMFTNLNTRAEYADFLESFEEV